MDPNEIRNMSQRELAEFVIELDKKFRNVQQNGMFTPLQPIRRDLQLRGDIFNIFFGVLIGVALTFIVLGKIC